MSTRAQAVTIELEGGQPVSGLLQAPADPRICYVFAHGAGAGMSHPFMSAFAQGLFDRGIATLRYQFPYMERKSRRPDPPAIAHAAVRAAVAHAAQLMPELPLFAGGKSYGGRMTSQAQAESPLPHARGLVFVGFPLHPPKQPSDKRAEHLADVNVPMLFLQGTRDELADQQLLESAVKRLGSRAVLKLYQDADHSFHVPARSKGGRTDAQVMAEMLDDAAQWMQQASPQALV